MKRLYLMALLVALSSPTVSFSANGDGQGSTAGARVSGNAETFGLLHPEMSGIDKRFLGWSKDTAGLDRSGYGFTYAGSWESSSPHVARHDHKPLYGHH
ncbi:hypothetical protein AWB81_08203 [Caballeronia arationis]|nr:hypothetical protein AWB81_08203 [Caballeronia arationis]